MSGAPAIALSPRDRWLQAHREILTASRGAAVLGEDPRRGPFAVWAEMTSDVEPEETLPMRRGRRWEALIVQEYGEQTGRSVTPWPPYEILRHPTVSFLGATLDATTLLDAARIPLEAKLALGSAGDWKDGAPLYYEIQAQLQAQCFRSPATALAGLVGPGPLKTFDLERDDAFFHAALPILERFMWHVRTKTPPEADGKPGTSAAIRRLWAQADGSTVALDGEAQQLVEEWEMAKARQETAMGTAQALGNRLRAQLGVATFGALPDGSFITLKETHRKAYEVDEVDYRTLRRWWPKHRRRG